MADKLDFGLAIRLLDKYSGPAQKVSAANQFMVKRLRETKKVMNEVNQQGKKIDYLEQLQKSLGDSGRKIDDAKKKLASLHKEFNQAEKAGKATKALTKRIDSQRKALAALTDKHQKHKTSLSEVRGELRKAGYDTRNLTKARDMLASKTSALNNKLKRQSMVMASITKATNVAATAYNGLKIAAGAAIGFMVSGAGAASAFVGTAAQFEKYQIMLESLQGSKAGAKQAMAWVDEFAVKTPLALDGVMDAFVKLKSFGIDPMNGTLKAAVDVNAKLGGDQQKLEGIILALGQAWTKQKLQGEEALQLIERGVPVWDLLSEKLGKTGPELMKMASKGKLGRKEIQLLIDAMEKWGDGAAQKQMGAWDGLVANMGDQWTRFKRMVMDSGPFQLLKSELETVLATINKMANNGQLQVWAERVGQYMVEAITSIKQFGVWLYNTGQTVVAVSTKVANFVGGWENLAMIMVALKATSMVGWLTSLSGALTAFSVMGRGIMAAMFISGLKLGPVLATVGVALKTLATIAMGHPLIATIALIATGLAYLATKVDWSAWAQKAMAAWNRFSQSLGETWAKAEAGFNTAKQVIGNGINDMLTSLSNVPANMMQAGRDIMNGLAEGMYQRIAAVTGTVTGIADKVVSSFKNLLGIHSPSRVFMGLGEHISSGLSIGISKRSSDALKAVKSMGSALPKAMPAAAMAGGLTVAAHANPTGSGLPMPQTQQPIGGDTISITINANGGNASDIAREVQRVLDERDAAKARGARGRLYD